MAASVSAYGKGAPSYDNVKLQRSAIAGRLVVAEGIIARARVSTEPGAARTLARWLVVRDELLDRLLEVRGA